MRFMFSIVLSFVLLSAALLFSGCASAPRSVAYVATPRVESSGSLLAEVQAACASHAAHETRRVHRAIMVRPGFWVSCH